jgi:ABC-2 type transport system ATP-binding protein
MTAPATGTTRDSGGIAAAPPPGLPAAPAIEALNVSRWYGNIVAVNDISFALSPGITGLLGPNGAGKSTILHMMAGFLKPSNGAMHVLGRPSWGNVDMYRRVGLVPEREAVYPFMTGYEFVRDSARLHRLPDPDAAARRAIAGVELEFAEGRAMGGGFFLSTITGRLFYMGREKNLTLLRWMSPSPLNRQGLRPS